MINGPVWDERILQEENTWPTILAVGDSWFWYLKNNLSIPLHKIVNKDKNNVILVRGANGADSVEYQKGPIREQIDFDLSDRGYGKSIRAVFLSGGGNDFAGPEDFTSLLKPDCSEIESAQQCFKENQPEKLFKTVSDALLSVVELVEQKIPGTPVFIHSYDYANPNGRGFLGMGQWLQYPMNTCKVQQKLHQPLINHLIDKYWDELNRIKATAPTIRLIDQRGTLSREEWDNELHPTSKGFNKVAKKWENILKKEGIA